MIRIISTKGGWEVGVICTCSTTFIMVENNLQLPCHVFFTAYTCVCLRTSAPCWYCAPSGLVAMGTISVMCSIQVVCTLTGYEGIKTPGCVFLITLIHLFPKWCRSNYRSVFLNSFYESILWALPVKSVLCDCHIYNHWWLVNIDSGNGLVQSGSKPLPEPNVDLDLCRHMVSLAQF